MTPKSELQTAVLMSSEQTMLQGQLLIFRYDPAVHSKQSLSYTIYAEHHNPTETAIYIDHDIPTQIMLFVKALPGLW
jgi:hypothetical protein